MLVNRVSQNGQLMSFTNSETVNADEIVAPHGPHVPQISIHHSCQTRTTIKVYDKSKNYLLRQCSQTGRITTFKSCVHPLDKQPYSSRTILCFSQYVPKQRTKQNKCFYQQKVSAVSSTCSCLINLNTFSTYTQHLYTQYWHPVHNTKNETLEGS